MSLNENLRKAKRQKNDEFYTQLSDIENELRHYAEHFRSKVVYCDCDDPRISNFFHYFSYNFERLGLKKLVTACYRKQERDLFSRHDSERAIWLEYKGSSKGGRVPDVGDIGIREFEGDGDFRSPECIELLDQADIVVTNPPHRARRHPEPLTDGTDRPARFHGLDQLHTQIFRQRSGRGSLPAVLHLPGLLPHTPTSGTLTARPARSILGARNSL